MSQNTKSSLWVVSLLLVIAIVYILYIKGDRTTSANISEPSTEMSGNNDDIADKFVGTWKFLDVFPGTVKDHSMDGLMCDITRYPNTKETFLVNWWDGTDLIFSLKDNNTLVGQNVGMTIKYEEGQNQIKVYIGSDKGEIFTKLQ
jgi:hypothetical protein